MLRSALKILPLFFFLTFVWAIGVQVILVPGLLIAWQIGFAPMIIAVQNPDAWQAVKASSRIAGQTSAQSLTLWTFASFLIAITLILRAVILRSGPALSIQYGVGMGIFLVVIAAIEAVLNGALAGIYLSSQPARTSSASAAA